TDSAFRHACGRRFGLPFQTAIRHLPRRPALPDEYRHRRSRRAHHSHPELEGRRQVSLTAGSRLGPYEILSALGAGGMGEVYRATDTNLKRQVAIKVLPQTVAADPERLARFQREAEVLAA